MKDTFFKDASNFLRKDINVTLSLSYIVLVAIGMLFDVIYYAQFDVNIVAFSDISDFLLAPFRDPFILIFVVGSIILISATLILEELLEANYPKIYKSMFMGIDQNTYNDWYKRYNGTAFLLLMYIFFTAQIYGVFKANKVYKGNSQPMHIVFKDNKFTETDTLQYVGKTNGYTFLFNKGKKQVEIIPMSDVLRLELDKK
jgi:hypothetical protein